MRSVISIFVLALCFSGSAFAVTESAFSPVSDNGSPAYPVSNSVLKNKDAQGSTSLSIRSDVKRRPENADQPVYSKFSMAWSYGRGVGVIPNTCPEGYKNEFWGCKKGSELKPKICPAGSEKQAGLCYKRCATKFKGVGPMCHGYLADLDVSEVSEQVKSQYNDALANAKQPGIALMKDKMPRLKTDIKFNAVVCSKKKIINLIGNKKLPNFVNKNWKKIADKIAGKKEIKGSDGKTAWVVPGLSDVVLLDLAFKATCSEDEESSKANINVDSAVTVKLSTKVFDTAFHNLGGVSIGIAKVSIYELIPFRIYGSVSSKIGTKLDYTSIIYKNMKPAMFENTPHAHRTVLDIKPQLNLMLGSQAYLRLPSFTSALPDLMQVGANTHLAVVDFKVPYYLEEGINKTGSKLELKESLHSQVISGSGYMKPFFKLLGRSIKVFNEKHTLKWKGYENRKTLLIREGSYAL